MTDEDQRLLGVITDGDIRRALLQGLDLDSPAKDHVSTKPLTIRPESSRSAAIDLLRAHRILAAPIVDAEGHLLGVHTLSHLVGVETRLEWAVIMAGGRGSRLRPLTESVPKPLLPVAGRPIAEWLLMHLIGCGFRNVVFSTGYLSEQVVEHFGDGSRFGCRIEYVVEAAGSPLGTVGALRSIAEEIPESCAQSVLVANGDIFVEYDLSRLIHDHRESNAAMTVAYQPYIHEVPFGVLNESSDGIVKGIEEKPVWRGKTATGVYVISPSVLALIDESERLDAPDLVRRAIARSLVVRSHEITGGWVDIGTPNQLRHINSLGE